MEFLTFLRIPPLLLGNLPYPTRKLLGVSPMRLPFHDDGVFQSRDDPCEAQLPLASEPKTQFSGLAGTP